MNLTVDQRKLLVEKYPYLIPRNVFTDKVPDNYSYSYIVGENSLPEGWFRLFLLYCKSIKSLLDDADYTNKFRFTQVKEKYGSLRIYSNGLPRSAQIITHMYELYSCYVCSYCGNIARYVSDDYIEPWCEVCISRCKYSHHKIYRPSELVLHTYSSALKQHERMCYSIRNLHRRYLSCIKMNDQEFFQYLIDTDINVI